MTELTYCQFAVGHGLTESIILWMYLFISAKKLPQIIDLTALSSGTFLITVRKLEDKLSNKRFLFVSHWSARKTKTGSSPLSVSWAEFRQWGEENVVVGTARCSEHDACVTRYLLWSLKTGINASKIIKDDERFWDYYHVISASKHTGIITLSFLLLRIYLTHYCFEDAAG